MAKPFIQLFQIKLLTSFVDRISLEDAEIFKWSAVRLYSVLNEVDKPKVKKNVLVSVQVQFKNVHRRSCQHLRRRYYLLSSQNQLSTSPSSQDIPLYIATISFAVTITPHISVSFDCHKLENGHVTLALKPKAKLRIGGGATASLAVTVQGRMC